MADLTSDDKAVREGREAEGRTVKVFNKPGATALKRIREKRLNDFARNDSDESSAALIGAI